MFLRKMTLFGFKSFAEKVTLDFSRGITAVVGPNGCGKSNIIDALRWTLGEQSAKIMRGDRMEDIIFSGTESRKPLNFAEVNIFFEDASSQLNSEFEEIQITRRLYRSGESEYYINKASCRLKDINELFMDTGIGKEVYSVVGQNRVEEIVTARPEERRVIIEEAAGILKYKNRKKEARQRLEEMRKDLYRVTDLISELENQLEPIKGQAKIAHKYLKLKEELKENEQILFSCRLEKNKQSLEKLNVKYSKVEDEKLKVTKELNEKNETWEKVKNRVDDLAEAKRKLETNLQSFLYEKDQLDSRRKLWEEKIQNISQQKENNHDKLKNSENRCTKLREDKDDWLQQFYAKEKAMEKANEKIKELKEKVESYQNDDSLLNIENLQQELTSVSSRQEALESTLSELEHTKGNTEQKIIDLKGEYYRQEEKLESINEKIEEREKENEEKSESMQIIEKDLDEAIAAEEKCRLEVSRLNEEITSFKEKLSAQENRLWILHKYQRGQNPFQEGAEFLLNNESTKQGLLGNIASILHIPSELKPSIETAIGDKIFGVVVQDEKTAKKAVNHLLNEQKGWSNIFPVNLMQKAAPIEMARIEDFKNISGVKGRAVDLIKFDSAYQYVAKWLLGNFIITEDLDSALEVARKSEYNVYVVTLDGQVVYPGGVIRAGKNSSESYGTWNVNEEVKELEDEINNLTQEKDGLEKKLKEKKQQEQNLQNKIKEFKKHKEQQNQEITALKQNISLMNKEKEHVEEELQKLNNSIDSYIEEKSDMQNRIDDYANELETTKKSRSEISTKLEKLKEKYQHILEERDEVAELLTNQQVEYNRSKEQINYLEEKIREADQELTKINEDMEKYKQENERLERSLEELKNELENEKTKEDELAEKNKDTNMEYDQVKTQYEELQAHLTELEKQTQSLKTKNSRLEKQEQKLELEKTRLQAEIDHQKSLYKEKFGSLAEPFQNISGVDESQVLEEINRVQNEIENLGHVRIGAIDEEERLSERLKFLYSQQEDLENGESSLQEILAEIDERIKNQFKEALEEIGNNFKNTFAELFGGGEAMLKIADENNILESGVEFYVQPPGKNLKNISLLSTGEKALTAIALLFAIFKYKPAPFYFLDEIESSLDENNLAKFLEFLQKSSSNAQFILNTHRRKTMEKADIVYGVTMPESGISKIVSLKLNQKAS